MNRVTNTNLEALIAERAEEKRIFSMEKRKNDISALKKGNISGMNYEPFPNGSYELLMRNNIFEKLLEFMTDISDITSAYYACQTFKTLLREKRILMLLPKTLAILQEKKELLWDENDENEFNFVTLRGVSKTWKEVVDYHIFESSLSNDSWFLRFELEELDEDGPDVCYFQSDCEYDDEKTLDQAISIFCGPQNLSPSPNPLFRKLAILTDNSERFHAKLNQFLEIYGESVWLLIYTNESYEEVSMTLAYEHLWKTLKLTPNLKALILSGITEEQYNQSEEDNLQFEEKLARCPPPNLESLKYLYFDNEKESLISQILQNSVNLRTLIYSYSQKVNAEMVSALQGLQVERYVWDECDDDDDEGDQIQNEHRFSSLVQTNRLNWPLKVLDIVGLPESIMKASVLFPILNTFHLTLERLSIFEPVARDNTNVTLELHNLKFLHLEDIDRDTIGFDDMLNLESLQEIVVDSLDDDYENGKVEVARFLKKMHKSNIWKCFPNLRRLEVDDEVYLRAGLMAINDQLSLRLMIEQCFRHVARFFRCSSYR